MSRSGCGITHFSLRSRNKRVDVSEIAKLFGGVDIEMQVVLIWD